MLGRITAQDRGLCSDSKLRLGRKGDGDFKNTLEKKKKTKNSDFCQRKKKRKEKHNLKVES